MNTEQIELEQVEKEISEYGQTDIFNELPFFEKWKKVSEGLSQPPETGIYKWAKLQRLRLLAPIAAFIVPIFSILVICLFAALAPVPQTVITVTVMEPEPIEEKLDKIEEIIPPDPPEPVEVETDVISDSPYVGADSQAAPGPVADFSPVPATFDAVAIVKSPVIMKGIYGARTGAARGAAIAGGGGGSATELAVLRALRWLKTKQNSDGSWDKVKPAMTALALLTFLAHGETPASEEFGLCVEMGLKWMLENQKDDGHFNGADSHDYSHPIAAYALSEAYGLTMVPDLKYAAEKAIKIVVQGQHPNGGWDYNCKQSQRDDTSYMGWCAQAIKAAKMAHLEVDGLEEACKKSIDGFKANSKGNYESCGFGYTGPSADHGLSSVGALCMMYHGAGKADEVLGALKLMDTDKWNFTLGDSQLGKNGLYYWYYATQAKFYAGGDTWNRWNKMFSPALVKAQIVIPKEQSGYTDHKGRPWSIGHWDQYQGHGAENEIFGTVLCTLQLEVYYRYLPTFKPVEAQEIIQEVKKPKDKEMDIDIVF